MARHIRYCNIEFDFSFLYFKHTVLFGLFSFSYQLLQKQNCRAKNVFSLLPILHTTSAKPKEHGSQYRTPNVSIVKKSMEHSRCLHKLKRAFFFFPDTVTLHLFSALPRYLVSLLFRVMCSECMIEKMAAFTTQNACTANDIQC